MGMALKIRTILLERNMSIKELSEKLGYKGANLYNKLRRDNFTEKELREIANILNCDYDGIFTFRDTGKQVWQIALIIKMIIKNRTSWYFIEVRFLYFQKFKGVKIFINTYYNKIVKTLDIVLFFFDYRYEH